MAPRRSGGKSESTVRVSRPVPANSTGVSGSSRRALEMAETARSVPFLAIHEPRKRIPGCLAGTIGWSRNELNEKGKKASTMDFRYRDMAFVRTR